MIHIERILTEDEHMIVDMPELSGRVRISINRISAHEFKLVIAESESEDAQAAPVTSLSHEDMRQRLAAASHLQAPKSANSLPPPDYNAPLTREEARRRLAAAGLLADTSFIPDDLERPDIPPFVPPLGSKTTEQLIDEDRGER